MRSKNMCPYPFESHNIRPKSFSEKMLGAMIWIEIKAIKRKDQNSNRPRNSWGEKKNSISAEGTGKADEVSGTRPATSASDRLVQNFSALQMRQESRGSAAVVAGSRQEREFWGREKLQIAAPEGSFRSESRFSFEGGGVSEENIYRREIEWDFQL